MDSLSKCHAWAKNNGYDTSAPAALKTALAIYGVYTLVKNVTSTLTLDKLMNMIPGVQGAVDAELKKEVAKNIEEMFPALPFLDPSIKTLSIPEEGLSVELLEAQLAEWQKRDATADGSHFAYMYASDNEAVTKFAYSVFRKFQNENALNPTAFPALRHLEVTVTKMVAGMLHAPADAVGTLTSGGSESLICMLKAYRDRARVLWPHITRPEVVAPITIHAAVGKGAHMLGLTVRYIPLDEHHDVDLAAYRAAIGANTVLLLGSAPQYPHGIVDPIGAIGELARTATRHTIPVHVDACVGGFVLPFAEQLGYPVPLWDFRVPEVTSVSADLHKFGYTPKGVSTLVFRSADIRKHQFWSTCEWPGGLFVSPSVLGTRSGGPIAAAWATLMATGVQGYLEPTRKAMETRVLVQEAVEAIPELAVVGRPAGCLIAWRSVDPAVNIFVVADALEQRELVFADGTRHALHGWSIEKQHRPDCVHMTCMPKHRALAERLVRDMRAAVRYAREHPERVKQGSAAMYGMVAQVPTATLVDRFLVEFESQVYDVNPAFFGQHQCQAESKEQE